MPGLALPDCAGKHAQEYAAHMSCKPAQPCTPTPTPGLATASCTCEPVEVWEVPRRAEASGGCNSDTVLEA